MRARHYVKFHSSFSAHKLTLFVVISGARDSIRTVTLLAHKLDVYSEEEKIMWMCVNEIYIWDQQQQQEEKLSEKRKASINVRQFR